MWRNETPEKRVDRLWWGGLTLLILVGILLLGLAIKHVITTPVKAEITWEAGKGYTNGIDNDYLGEEGVKHTPVVIAEAQLTPLSRERSLYTVVFYDRETATKWVLQGSEESLAERVWSRVVENDGVEMDWTGSPENALIVGCSWGTEDNVTEVR
jgi:hypothetical protein